MSAHENKLRLPEATIGHKKDGRDNSFICKHYFLVFVAALNEARTPLRPTAKNFLTGAGKTELAFAVKSRDPSSYYVRYHDNRRAK